MAGWPPGRAAVDGLVAGAVAGVVSGLPSTVLAARRRTDLLEATRAAGTLLGRPTLWRGAVAHGVLSLGWGVALSVVWPGRAIRAAGASSAREMVMGAVAGAAIAALDLELVGRRLPAVRALPAGPQWLDHLAYGAVVGMVLGARATSGPTGLRQSGPLDRCCFSRAGTTN